MHLSSHNTIPMQLCSVAAPTHTTEQRRLRQGARQPVHARTFSQCMRHRPKDTSRTTQHSRAVTMAPLAALAQPSSSPQVIGEADLRHLIAAAELSLGSVGHTQPHPNAACLLVDGSGRVLARAFQWAQGTESPEAQAAAAAGPAAAGSTAYLNLETGDCHGECAGVRALLSAGVRRVVLGLRHPLPHLRGVAMAELRAAGLEVAVLGETPCSDSGSSGASSSGSSFGGGGSGGSLEQQALDACLRANEPLLHRAVTGRPLGILKYAMTADGKIATAAGHSAWVSSPDSRALVFETRAASDAVIVGGQTVRRDNPRLTTRQEGGHQPARVVLSRTLDLPEQAHLWDVSAAPTIVMTQRGARRDLQRRLRSRGVEVVEFDFLTPAGVVAYCHERGFLQLLWECGGTLAAPAIAEGVIHKTMAFIAPKLIGGTRAPTPVGDLGFVEMTQALPLAEHGWRIVGPDLLLTGYLPASGGLRALAAAAAEGRPRPAQEPPSSRGGGRQHCQGVAAAAEPSAAAGVGSSGARAGDGGAASSVARRYSRQLSGAIEFYKAWDHWGALGNFSPHAVDMPLGPMTRERAAALSRLAPGADPGEPLRRWPSVEHYYQAQKFAGSSGPQAEALTDAIAAAASPEEAARLGRTAQRERPHLQRPDWYEQQTAVMKAALRAKFTSHHAPRAMLLSTAAPSSSSGSGDSGGAAGATGPDGGRLLVEASPHDYYWGRGFDGSGQNMLGRLLMELRGELLAEEAADEWRAPAAEMQRR